MSITGFSNKNQKAIGKLLIELKHSNPQWSTSECAEYIMDYGLWRTLPNNPKHESLGSETAAAYREHLEAQGDRYSLEMLSHLKTGEPISDDPAGS